MPAFQFRVYPYRMYSQAAARLAERLNTTRVFPDREYRNRRHHIVVNWGNSQRPAWELFTTRWLNHPHAVGIASNKLHTLRTLAEFGVRVPQFAQNIEGCQAWSGEYHTISRATLNGYSGMGVGYHESYEQVPPGLPLYTQYIPKRKEYRVHVFRGRVIDRAEKRRAFEADEVDYQVRSHNNGWIFAREGVEIDSDCENQAATAVNALGLDFGAVDLVKNVRDNQHYVLEVNTAPGLEGRTIESYATAFESFRESLEGANPTFG